MSQISNLMFVELSRGTVWVRKAARHQLVRATVEEGLGDIPPDG